MKIIVFILKAYLRLIALINSQITRVYYYARIIKRTWVQWFKIKVLRRYLTTI